LHLALYYLQQEQKSTMRKINPAGSSSIEATKVQTAAGCPQEEVYVQMRSSAGPLVVAQS